MVVAGEVRPDAYVDIQQTARRVIDRIGYNRSELQFDAASCGILSAIHEQSSDINQGVVRSTEEEQGAGDPGHNVRLRHPRVARTDACHADSVARDFEGTGGHPPRGQGDDLPASRCQEPGYHRVR